MIASGRWRLTPCAYPLPENTKHEFSGLRSDISRRPRAEQSEISGQRVLCKHLPKTPRVNWHAQQARCVNQTLATCLLSMPGALHLALSHTDTGCVLPDARAAVDAFVLEADGACGCPIFQCKNLGKRAHGKRLRFSMFCHRPSFEDATDRASQS